MVVNQGGWWKMFVSSACCFVAMWWIFKRSSKVKKKMGGAGGGRQLRLDRLGSTHVNKFSFFESGPAILSLPPPPHPPPPPPPLSFPFSIQNLFFFTLAVGSYVMPQVWTMARIKACRWVFILPPLYSPYRRIIHNQSVGL